MDLQNSLNPLRFTLLTVVVELSLVPLALWIEDLWPRGPGLGLDWDPQALLLGALGTVPPVALLLWMVAPRNRGLEFLARIRRMLREVVGPLIAGLDWWHMALVSLSAGIGEEALFRGVLQPRLGLAAASILFGLLHPFTLAYIALAALLGAYLGWLQSMRGNILAPILVHALYDLAALIVMRREMREPPESGSQSGSQED
jgi:CAAX protease family protein